MAWRDSNGTCVSASWTAYRGKKNKEISRNPSVERGGRGKKGRSNLFSKSGKGINVLRAVHTRPDSNGASVHALTIFIRYPVKWFSCSFIGGAGTGRACN